MELPLGTKLKDGNFHIGKLLKKGYFSITYMGSDAKLQKPVVIQEFFPQGCTRNQYSIQPSDSIKNNSQEFKNEFLNEGRILSKINHPSIVVYECFKENNTVYRISEYLRGKTLLELLESNGYLPEDEVIRYIKKVGETLEILHERNLLHLDIKPENIFLTEDGQVVLTEFGEAKQEAERKRLTQQIGLNPNSVNIPKTLRHGYAAKELFLIGEKLGTYTDIYALAATAYHLLSGKIPTPAIERLKGKELNQLSNISSVTNSAVMKGLKIEAQERIQSVRDFLAIFDIDNKPPINDVPMEPEIVENQEQKLINSFANFCVELEQTFDTFCELLINFLTIDPGIFENKKFVEQLRR
ncbi:MAG: serine/threonine-protein kinase, partial [Cyanobacteria bacterium P01_G01_bin.49]